MLATEVCQERAITEQQLLDLIEDRFEDTKRRFDPYDASQPRTTSVCISIDGVLIGHLNLNELVPPPSSPNTLSLPHLSTNRSNLLTKTWEGG
jgi:hypothetical protein